MKNKTASKPLLSKDEFLLIANGLQALLDDIEQRSKDVFIYMNEGHHYGLIPQAGKEYEIKSRPLYELRKAIQDRLAEDDQSIRDLRNKLHHLFNNNML